jgi:predicted phage terminase large subunit-like protein
MATLLDTSPRQIRPQPGPQEAFLASPADVAIYGGAAGSGKTMALLLEAARNIHVNGYYGVIFRRTTPQIRNEGGLWDESQWLYRSLGGWSKESTLEWRFRAPSRIRFAHMEYEKNRYDWQGSQLVFIGFDELTHFSSQQFWYMFSRMRSACGIPAYLRATCNPDPDSFVAELVHWYINPESGYPIPERSGVIRYFARVQGDRLLWGASPKEIITENPHIALSDIKSFTFVAGNVHDNPILLENNPSYLSNLKALNLVDRERLLRGNWHIRPAAGTIFRREWFQILDAVPSGGKAVRYWDRAASEPSPTYPDPDWTVGVKMRCPDDGFYYVEDVVRFRGTPNKVWNNIRNTAEQDGVGVQVLLARDPGQAGKAECQALIRFLQGFNVRGVPETKAKEVRAKAPSAQVEAGNVKIKRANWNRVFLDELENFGSGNGHDDQADAFNGAMNGLIHSKRQPRVGWL